MPKRIEPEEELAAFITERAKEIGARLKDRRENGLELTQQQVATHFNATGAWLSPIESGESFPRLDHFLGLCHVLRMDPVKALVGESPDSEFISTMRVIESHLDAAQLVDVVRFLSFFTEGNADTKREPHAWPAELATQQLSSELEAARTRVAQREAASLGLGLPTPSFAPEPEELEDQKPDDSQQGADSP